MWRCLCSNTRAHRPPWGLGSALPAAGHPNRATPWLDLPPLSPAPDTSAHTLPQENGTSYRVRPPHWSQSLGVLAGAQVQTAGGRLGGDALRDAMREEQGPSTLSPHCHVLPCREDSEASLVITTTKMSWTLNKFQTLNTAGGSQCCVLDTCTRRRAHTGTCTQRPRTPQRTTGETFLKWRGSEHGLVVVKESHWFCWAHEWHRRVVVSHNSVCVKQILKHLKMK